MSNEYLLNFKIYFKNRFYFIFWREQTARIVAWLVGFIEIVHCSFAFLNICRIVINFKFRLFGTVFGV